MVCVHLCVACMYVGVAEALNPNKPIQIDRRAYVCVRAYVRSYLIGRVEECRV